MVDLEDASFPDPTCPDCGRETDVHGEPCPACAENVETAVREYLESRGRDD